MIVLCRDRIIDKGKLKFNCMVERIEEGSILGENGLFDLMWG